jgi:ABC-type Fe3+/spermidine/putrescine transport system ATPase subunit
VKYPSLPEMPFNDLVKELYRDGIHIESPSLSSFVGEAVLVQSQMIEYVKVISISKKVKTSDGGVITTATGRQYGVSSKNALVMVWSDWEIVYIPKGKRKQRFSKLNRLGSFVILAQEWQEVDQEEDLIEPMYGYRSPQRFAAMLQSTQNILYARF